MWDWRYRSNAAQKARYSEVAGPDARALRGRTHVEMAVFYARLGMRSLRNPRGINLRHALNWTPVIFTSVHEATGHAMVAVGYRDLSYHIVNPCGTMQVSFEEGADDDTCAAGTAAIPRDQTDEMLGEMIWYW